MLPFSIISLAVLPLVASLSSSLSPSYLFSNPTEEQQYVNQIPSSYESAVMARRILHLTPHGILSTTFPTANSEEQRPTGLEGLPIGLMDYVADCESDGNPTILAIKIATAFKNVAAGSNISLAMQWTPPYKPSKRISANPTTSYSAANLPRFSLIGYLEKIEANIVDKLKLAQCFSDIHPDAKYWLPGNPIHTSEWVRLVVTHIYWVGGFGDRAYIGWIPVEEWKNVTRAEWEQVRLPGEKPGWKEWLLNFAYDL